MRLSEVERGDTLAHRTLIRMISRFSGYRLPDAARVAFYHRDFVSTPLGEWTQRVMRGPSSWTVAERELMAAMVASWTSSPFCVGAHRAIAVHDADPAVADAALTDYATAPISDRLRTALTFLERLTMSPDAVDAGDVRAAMAQGLDAEALKDAAAVGAVFAIIARNANALDYEIPSDADFARAAGMLLRRGYA